ncbi:MAG: hypothetical protein WC596_01090 [Candidatus Shapirobacteria bacterium]
MSKILRLLPIIGVIFLFLFLRFYNINDSFFFFNDMGRDMMVLQTWQETGKPPLLGPQTSALPFNQSAIYFYLLYPGFLLSKGNPISLVYTLAFIYLFSFLLGLYLLRKDKPLTKVLLIAFFFISIHPQYIIQGRYVWNPSFVTPFLIISIISFYLLLKKFSIPKTILFSAGIATAISISYSVAPLLIIFALYWLLFSRSNFKAIALSLFGALALINLPTIFFELRHRFFLTTALLTKNSPPQKDLAFVDRLNNLSQYVFSFSNQTLNISLFIASILLCLFLLYKNRQKRKNLQFVASFLYLGITILAFVTPITIQAHYIFAFTSLLFVIIAGLRPLVTVLSLVFFSLNYLQPTRLKQYFTTASRTTTQMEQCFRNYCDSFKEPTFVSVQSSLHPFHNGPEHRFLLKKAGCNIKDIETQNGQAEYMTVVVDQSTFDQNTNYYELSLLGSHQTVRTFPCQNNFYLVLIRKTIP